MQPRFNLWLESDNQVVLSLWRADLLRAVARCGSISAAAEHMAVPYRTAWRKIHEMETGLGYRLVQTQIGGAHGGGATLTPAAERLLARFDRLAHDMERFVADAFAAHFAAPD